MNIIDWILFTLLALCVGYLLLYAIASKFYRAPRFPVSYTHLIKKMLNHIGYVAWGGCGFMGPTPGKIEGVLPNLGVGLRIEVQPRMNVRLDLGRDMVNKQNLFYFNMTEAF